MYEVDRIESLPSGQPGKQPISQQKLSPDLGSLWSADGGKMVITSSDETGKEVVQQDGNDKEAVHHEWSGKEVIKHGEKEVVPLENQGDKEVVPSGEALDNRPRRLFGVRRVIFYWILAAVLVSIGVGVGVGAGVRSQHHADTAKSHSTTNTNTSSTLSSQYYIGGALDPSFYSTDGAYNGSGVALASVGFDASDHGNLVLVFQHHTGQIRYMELSSSGSWTSGDSSQVISTDARNGTPISAVSYSVAEASTCHVFFIDERNRLRERIFSNTTSLWVDGPINNLDLIAFDVDQVGMQACWYGKLYQDSDYFQSGSIASNDSIRDENGIHMWYATNETTFQQLGWRAGDSDWTIQSTWTDKNGHAGVGCYSWEPKSTVTYVMMVNQQNSVEFWWKDTNASSEASTMHPINEWTKLPVSIPDVHPSSTPQYTNFVVVQMNATNEIRGFNISWNAEETSISGSFVIPIAPGLPGTDISVITLPENGGENTLMAFYQTKGDDITQFSRSLTDSQSVWAVDPVDIPSE